MWVFPVSAGNTHIAPVFTAVPSGTMFDTLNRDSSLWEFLHLPAPSVLPYYPHPAQAMPVFSTGM